MISTRKAGHQPIDPLFDPRASLRQLTPAELRAIAGGPTGGMWQHQ